MRSGRELTLDQVVTDLDAFGELLGEALRTLYVNLDPEEYEAGIDRLVKDITEGKYLTGSEEFSWSVGYEGIMVLFDPALILDFAQSGQSTAEVAIPYLDQSEVFTDSVLHTPDTWTMRVTSASYLYDISASDYIDLDNDGVLENIFLDFSPSGQGGMNGNIVIWDDDNLTEDSIFENEKVSDVSAYVVKNTADEYYLFLPCRYAEDFWTEVFLIGSEGLQQTGSSFAGSCEYMPFGADFTFIFSNPDNFNIYGYIPLMGSHFGTKAFRLNQTYMYPEELDPEISDGLLYFESYNEEMKVARPIEGRHVTWEQESDDVMPVQAVPGEVMNLYRTDQESFVDFIRQDGSVMRVEVTVTDMGEYLYEDEPLEDFFEDVSYAVG